MDDKDYQELLLGSEDAQYCRVDVTFPSTPDTDFVVTHTLRVVDPESVEYRVLRSDRAVLIYDNQSATRKTWGKGFIVLRADVASAKVRLLLTVPRI